MTPVSGRPDTFDGSAEAGGLQEGSSAITDAVIARNGEESDNQALWRNR